MGTPLPFIPFQNRVICGKFSWKKRALSFDQAVDDVVHDGDTAYLFVDKGERGYDNPPCRLYGIDTPEINSSDPAIKAAAVAARDFLVPLILGKDLCVIKLTMDPHGRPVVLIWTDPADFGDRAKSVNRKMVDAGHAIYRYQTHGTLD